MCAWRSTYWPVTSVAFVVRSEVFPSPFSPLQHGGELAHRHLQRDAARGRAAAPRTRLGLRVGHEAAVGAGEVGQLGDRPVQVAAFHGQPEGPGLLILAGWPTAPLGSVGVVEAGVSGAGVAGPVVPGTAAPPHVADPLAEKRGTVVGGGTDTRLGQPRGQRRGCGRAAHHRADRAGQHEDDDDAGGPEARGAAPPRRRCGAPARRGRLRGAFPSGPRRPSPCRPPSPASGPRPAARARMSAGPAAGTSKASPAWARREARRSSGARRWVNSSERGASPAPARAASAGSAARRRRPRAAGSSPFPGLPADGEGDLALAQVGVVAQHDHDAQRRRAGRAKASTTVSPLALLGTRLEGRPPRPLVGQFGVAPARLAVGDLAGGTSSSTCSR